MNAFITVAELCKTADGPDYQGMYRDQAMQDISQMALMSAGAGLTGRGLMGLYNLAKRNISPHRARYPAALVTKVPVPVDTDAPGGEGVDEVKTAEVTDHRNFWWYYPAMSAVGMAGAYGGWKALDSVLNQRKISEKDEEVENAKKDFSQALVQSYDRPRQMFKTAADLNGLPEGVKLGIQLDALYDAILEKTGTMEDTFGPMLGSYLGFYAAPSALITGLMSYNSAKRNNQASIVDKAMQRRLRRNYMSRPSEIYAVPEPVEAHGNPIDAAGVDAKTLDAANADERRMLSA